MAGARREESSVMGISPEGLEIKFPEESPLAVRRSKTTREAERQTRDRESLGHLGPEQEEPLPTPKPLAHLGSPAAEAASWGQLPTSSPGRFLLLCLGFPQQTTPRYSEA